MYQCRKINDQVYHIVGKDAVNCQLVVGSEKAVLFDTGYGFADLAAFIKGFCKVPVTVVNSHGHLDHVNGNNQFSGPCLIHKLDFPLAKQHSSAERRAECMERAKNNFDPMTGETTNVLPEGFDEAAYLAAKLPEFSFVQEGDILDLGDISLEVKELPGHTLGSIGLWWEKERILLSGDAFGPFTWLFAPEAGTLSQYRNTLQKIHSLAPRIILGGHESKNITMDELEVYIDCAEHVDFEKGMPWKPPVLEISENADIRICTREGYEPFQFGRPGFASLVIGRDHLN
ncbi:MAG: MBL fold metallo-hydrolase [Eubacteriales bacterium]|nr:MBL fold metallo-hydrolase [Eubacteriales bacterium]